ncbi:unnamed protein product [Lymnaea stagnalis]|uniref:Uncharacterized protein n=1 Tax=Lymnaea stagnalis TaxID=6523 RepID=A0AAV2HZ65_LYMST
MSNNSAPQRVRRNGSPSTTKQGPIKAVKAFSLKHGTQHKTASSPSPRESHQIWSRKSPDSRVSPERKSPAGTPVTCISSFSCISTSIHSQLPQSPNNSVPSVSKDRANKSHKHSPVAGKWRASSVDTVVPSYLTGQWPKDINNYHHYQSDGVFMCDKSTQTVAELEGKPEKRKKGHKRSASFGQGDQLKLQFIKQHLQKSKEGSKHTDGKLRSSPIPGKHSALSLTAPPALCSQHTKAILISAGHIPRHNMNRFQRNSVEGLNMEIEKLVSSVKAVNLSTWESDVDDHVFREIPDGHRAPVPEITRPSSTRSIDTQTPSGQLDHLLTPYTITVSRPASISPVTPSRPKSVDGQNPPRSRSDSTESKSSKENSPEPNAYLSSPKLEASCPFVREPPDGCEKITVVEESRRPLIKEPMLFSPVKPNQFVFKQSQGSAFCPLIKRYHEFTLNYGVPSPPVLSGIDG